VGGRMNTLICCNHALTTSNHEKQTQYKILLFPKLEMGHKQIQVIRQNKNSHKVSVIQKAATMLFRETHIECKEKNVRHAPKRVLTITSLERDHYLNFITLNLHHYFQKGS
jgi:hypothetical protein